MPREIQGPESALSEALASLQKLRPPKSWAARLESTSREAVLAIHARVLVEVPAFSASGNPEIIPELEAHLHDYVSTLARLMSGGEPEELEFARAHAQRRAAQRFPLEAVLEMHRSATPTLVAWLGRASEDSSAKVRDSIGSAARLVLGAFERAVSFVLAAEYVAHTRVLAEAESNRRTELLGLLLGGYDEADARVSRVLKRAGYLEQRRSYCVATLQSTDPLEMESPARALRIVEAATQAVSSAGIRCLIGLRGNVVTAVFSDLRRVSGWTAPQAKLADRLRPLLLTLGPAVLIGLSSDQPSTAFIPRGLQEATVALDFASVTDRLVLFSDLPIRRLLIHRGADYVQSAMPVWFPPLAEADMKAKGTLIESLRALADADINIQQAARRLTVHPNTLYARLERIRELTGLDAQRYHELTDLLLAADCRRT